MDDLEIGGSEAEGKGGRKAMERGMRNRGNWGRGYGITSAGDGNMLRARMCDVGFWMTESLSSADGSFCILLYCHLVSRHDCIAMKFLG